MFCKHEWIKDHEFTGRSAVQQMTDAGVATAKNLHPEHFHVPHFVIYKCMKCGSLKKFENRQL